MNFNFAKQINTDELISKKFDLFIMATSHEERFNYLFQNFDLSYKRLAILSYTSEVDFNIDTTTTNSTFYTVEDGKYQDIVIDLLNSELSFFINNINLNILVDYSCMTKTWYYTIMSYFASKDLNHQNIKVFFSYTPSEYTSPQNPQYNAVIEPIPGRFRMPNIDKPKALLVGLGYESKKAEGIIEYLDPKKTFALYSKPTLDSRFCETVETSNKDLLEKLKDNILTFPVDNLLIIEKILTSLYFSLNDEYSIIIAPLGPKPFTFISMLMSLKYDDIDVWRVHSASDFNRYSRKALKTEDLIICEVDYSIQKNLN